MSVVFDLNGTLIDSLPTITQTANSLLSENGLPDLSSQVVGSFVGLGEQVFLDRLIAATALEAGNRPALMERFIAIYKEVSQDTHLFAGVREALDQFAADGVPMGLCTNKPGGPTEVVLQTTDLARYFDVVAAGDTLPVRKPDPAPLHHAFEAIGAGVYVGDSETDAKTAEAASVPFVLFTEGIRVSPLSDIPHDAAFDRFDLLPAVISSLKA